MPYPAVKIFNEHVACVAKFVLGAIGFNDALNRGCIRIPVLHKLNVFFTFAEFRRECADDVAPPAPAFELLLPARLHPPGYGSGGLCEAQRLEVACASNLKRAAKAFAA